MPHMPILRPLALALLVLLQFPPPAVDVPKRAAPAWLAPYRDATGRLMGEALASDAAWQRLAYLGDTFGHRLSGSPNLEAAIRWAVEEMKRDGLENVRTEPVKVPHWVRGRESLEIVGADPAAAGDARPRQQRRHAGRRHRGRPARRPQLRGARCRARSRQGPDRALQRAVHDLRRDRALPRRGTVARRRARRRGDAGARRRARRACARRTPARSSYVEGQPQIPGRGGSTEDAARLQRMADRGTTVRLRLKMEARFLPDADSANVVGEIRGRELPDEVVVIGGHFDSWDVGTGSTDDGGGCIATWEALRLMKKLNLRPRRTVRVVLWTNEENGGRGGLAYRDRHLAELRQPRDDAGVRRRRVPPDRLRLQRHRGRPREGARHRHAAGRHPRRHDQPERRRRRHRPERPARRHPGDVARGGRQLLPDPPHAGRHGRQDRSARHRALVGGDRGHDLRDRGDARDGSGSRGSRSESGQSDRATTS